MTIRSTAYAELFAIVIAIFCGASAAAQSIFEDGFEPVTGVQVSISGPTEIVDRETTRRLAATVTATSGGVSQAVVWESSRTEIATVRDGVINRTASSFENFGTTVITATSVVDPTAQATYPVTIREPYLIHQYVFSESGTPPLTLGDSVGNADGMFVSLGNDGSSVNDGALTLAGGPRDSSAYVSLPENILQGLEDATIEIWVSPLSVRFWSRIFDFGSDFSNYLMMSWTRGSDPNTDRVEWRNDNTFSTRDDSVAPYVLPTQTQIAMVINGNAEFGNGRTQVSWYRDGSFRGSFFTELTLSQLGSSANSLGRSQYSFDDTANARYDELNIYRGALGDLDILESFNDGPLGGTAEPQFTFELTGPDQVTLGQVIELEASVVSTGGPVSQSFKWSSSDDNVLKVNQEISRFLTVGAFQLGTATITGQFMDESNQPVPGQTVSVDVTSLPPPWTNGRRLTANNVLDDFQSLRLQPNFSTWDGLDFPVGLPRGTGGHIQGVTRVDNLWILSHSRDNRQGLLIPGDGNQWDIETSAVGIGFHPGGIQAIEDIVMVTFKFGSNGIKFFQFDTQNRTRRELVHLTIPENLAEVDPAVLEADAEDSSIRDIQSLGRGESAGFAYHPVHGRFYLIDGANTGRGPSGGHDIYRTTKIGAPLTDTQNRWEWLGEVKDFLLDSDQVSGNDLAIYGSQGGMAMMYSESDQQMYVVAMSRLEGDDFTVPFNSHRLDVTRLDLDARIAEHIGNRSEFTPTPNVLFSPTFRFGGGMLLTDSGHIEFVGTERCASYVFAPGQAINQPPCEPFQDLVEYFILRR